ncbi:MAG: hypothetical protein IPL53_08460 [Ignavibacteria bacterium]|nr:hypothetical protein [Ignavibacteria bacterium]
MQKFYNDFVQKKDSRRPGEEYELVQEWADELNSAITSNWFQKLITEKEPILIKCWSPSRKIHLTLIT